MEIGGDYAAANANSKVEKINDYFKVTLDSDGLIGANQALWFQNKLNSYIGQIVHVKCTLKGDSASSIIFYFGSEDLSVKNSKLWNGMDFV